MKKPWLLVAWLLVIELLAILLLIPGDWTDRAIKREPWLKYPVPVCVLRPDVAGSSSEGGQ